MKLEERMKLIKQGREILKPNWNKLDTKETPKGLGHAYPDIVKSYDENSKIIRLKKEAIKHLSKKTLHEVIESRRSLRKYQDIALTMDQLSYLFYETSRMFKHTKSISFRAYPSGGATASLETYVYINKVEGLEKGIYRYLPISGDLLFVYNSENLEEEVNSALKNQLRDGAIVFFWTAIPYRTEFKYSFTAHKMIAIEAGHACQNLALACEAIDFGAVAISAYDQELCDKVLKVDGEEEFVIYLSVLGKR